MREWERQARGVESGAMITGQTCSSESEVLREAAEAMDGWISRLPPSSHWCLAFDEIREEILSCVVPPCEQTPLRAL